MHIKLYRRRCVPTLYSWQLNGGDGVVYSLVVTEKQVRDNTVIRQAVSSTNPVAHYWLPVTPTLCSVLCLTLRVSVLVNYKRSQIIQPFQVISNKVWGKYFSGFRFVSIFESWQTKCSFYNEGLHFFNCEPRKRQRAVKYSLHYWDFVTRNAFGDEYLHISNIYFCRSRCHDNFFIRQKHYNSNPLPPALLFSDNSYYNSVILCVWR